ncbi:uncharacterized protein [Periplaneta americana]|uniref:uncharacterized protein n=1 Tax=Periplaneta americana TaxID=6978 RepID=UPI0037E7492A
MNSVEESGPAALLGLKPSVSPSIYPSKRTRLLIDNNIMDEALIGAVFKREALWNPSDELHKNGVVLKKLWEDVAEELNKDGKYAVQMKYIKGRWKNLRAYFFKEYRKVGGKQHSAHGAEEISTSTWRLFDELKFLKNTTGVPHRDSSLLADSDTRSTADEGTMSCEEEIESSPLTLQPQRKKIRIPGNSKTDEKLLEIERKKIEIFEKESERERNGDHHFFESLLPYMAQIPLIRKLRLRSRIQDLILNELESLQSDISQPLTHFQSLQNNISQPNP